MTQDWIHAAFAPIRRYCPGWIADPIRRTATAVLTPLFFSYRTGHFRSSLFARAMRKNGQPLPWYTYPSIDFLGGRSYVDKSVLEFGAGQSTLWWAQRACQVVSFECDRDWYSRLKHTVPGNVDLHLASIDSASQCHSDVLAVLGGSAKECFDVIAIDGLYRREMAEMAKSLVSNDGIIICDNSEGYGLYDVFKDSDFSRVDFCGYAPGVVRPHVTSIFFRPDSFPFSAAQRITVQ